MRLPEKIRRTLEKLVAEMRVKDNVYGIGLFGSWSRSDAESTSDVDLLILEKGNFNHEYVERFGMNGLFIDIDHVPKQWIHGPIPTEIDQKLFEMQILYDRDWSLTNTKLLMTKSYASPERVDIRTEAHLVESDIYLSRATSALSREDFQSAYLFATIAFENVLKITAEIALEPLSNSHFLEKVETSTRKLEMPKLFNEYLEIARLNEADESSVKEKLKLFKLTWDEISNTTKQHPQTLEAAHFKVKTKLNYYLNSAFLQGTIMRANSLIDAGKPAETRHYLQNILLEIIENYAWLKSLINNAKVDYTTLIRSLENLEEKNPKNYNNILETLNLNEINKPTAVDAIEKTRETNLKVRRERKVLIKNHLIKT